MPEGGTLTVTTQSRSNRVTIQVEDIGVGMRPDLATRVFDPFSSTKGNHGRGLGLYAVRAIVVAHGGELRLDSEVGRGTRATISLPCCEPRPIPAASADRLSPALVSVRFLTENE